MSANPANPAEAQPKPPAVAKQMRLRYKATCRCGVELSPGEKAAWNSETRTMLCLDCAEKPEQVRPADVQPEDVQPAATAIPEPTATGAPGAPTDVRIFTLGSAAACSCGAALPAGTDAAWNGKLQGIQCLPCASAPAPAAGTQLPKPRGIKVLKLTRPAKCPCGARLSSGDRGGWHAETKTMLCLICARNWAKPPNPADALPDLPVDPGVPGGSAQKEYERRLAGHRKKVRTAHPVIGRLLLRFGDEPAEITSWYTGATGERRLAKKLATLGDLALCLHDRRVPRSAANLDHVVVGQAGVYVVDAKLYADAAVDIRRADARNKLPADQLRVSGRDGTKLITAMTWQTAAVRAALDLHAEFRSVPVIPILCFIEGTFPKWVPTEGNVDIGDVKVRGLFGASNLVLSDGPYDLPARNRLLQHLARELPAK